MRKSTKQQLNNLGRELTLEAEWKKNQRALLLSKINSQLARGDRSGVLATFFKRNARFMVRPMASAGLAIVLVFGGVLATVSASDESLPGQFLYPIKLTSEKIQVSLVKDSEKVELQLKLAQKRAEEIKAVSNRVSDPEERQKLLEKPLSQYKETIATLTTAAQDIKATDPQKAVDIAKKIQQSSQNVTLALSTVPEKEDVVEEVSEEPSEEKTEDEASESEETAEETETTEDTTEDNQLDALPKPVVATKDKSVQTIVDEVISTAKQAELEAVLLIASESADSEEAAATLTEFLTKIRVEVASNKDVATTSAPTGVGEEFKTTELANALADNIKANKLTLEVIDEAMALLAKQDVAGAIAVIEKAVNAADEQPPEADEVSETEEESGEDPSIEEDVSLDDTSTKDTE